MAFDIYTRKPIQNDTGEHIILDALGGRWKAKGIVDRQTNSDMGNSSDAALHRSIQIIRVLLGAKSGAGKPPIGIKNVRLVGGGAVDLDSRGWPRLTPKLQVTCGSDETGKVTKVIIDGHAPDRRTLKEITKRIRKEHNIPFSAIVADTVTARRFERPLSFELPFDEQSCRTLLKMACNLFASQHAELFRRDDFNEARTLVLTGGTTREHVAPNAIPLALDVAPADFGPLDHLISVRGHAESGRVEGLVVLYGHFQFVDFLGYTILQHNICLTYRVDQIGRCDRRNHQADLALTIPHFHNMRACAQENQSLLLSAWSQGSARIFDYVRQYQEAAWLAFLKDECASEVFGPDSDPSHGTPEQVAAFEGLYKQRLWDSQEAWRINNEIIRRNAEQNEP